MKKETFAVCVETHSRATRIGIGRDGCSRFSFSDFQKREEKVDGIRAAKHRAKEIIAAERAAGRNASVILRNQYGFGTSIGSLADFVLPGK